MSFSFRNIFSPDEGDLDGGASGMQLSGQTGADRNGAGAFGSSSGNAGLSYQAFLASELLAFIPPAISARSGIPMEKEVHVPFSTEGNRDVRLSTLYQMCPELFAAEITPLNDSVVTLPPRLGISTPPQSPAVAGSRASTANGSAAAGNNPFWSPVSTGEPKPESGKTTVMKEETPMPWAENSKPWPSGQKGAGDNPFSALGQTGGNAFASPGQESGKGASTPKIAGGFDGPPPPAATGMSESGGFAAGFQGFETSPPASVFKNSGSEAVRNPGEETSPGFSDNPFESKHGFTTLFSKGASADSGIPFPSAPLTDERVEDTPAAWGTMFHGGAAASPEAKHESADTGGELPVFEGFGSMISKASERQQSSPWGSSSAPFAGDSPFESLPEPQEPVAQTGPPADSGKGKGTEFAVFEPFPVPVEAEVPAPPRKPVPEVSWTIEPVASKQAPAPLPEVPARLPDAHGVVTPAKEFAGFASVKSQAEAAPAAPRDLVEPAPASGSSAASADQGFDLRDLELKAIFSTSESFTLSKVARRIVGLPGISSCALSTPGKLVQASRSEESRIGNEAREMVTTLRNLAKLTGLPEARTFTLHTDRGIVSLFLEEECCVIVHHESSVFPPGVREKLILVARSLINLEE